MKLSDKWFTAFSENDHGDLINIRGREDLDEFISSGKFKERVEITWKYTPDEKALPQEEEAELMDSAENAIRKVMEKDKLAILSSIYTGGGEKIWVFYTRTSRVFGEYLNEALKDFELLPISIYVEVDTDWEEYKDMYEMRDYAIDAD